VVFDVIGVFKVKLLWVHLDLVSCWLFKLALLLDELLKVLPRKLNDVLWASPNDFLYIVLQDSWEVVGHFNLLGSKDALVVYV